MRKPLKDANRGTWHDATCLTHEGAGSNTVPGLLNPPVCRASTIIFPSVEAYKDRHSGYYDSVIYGLYGTETTFSLAQAVAKLEGASNSIIVSSGTAAISLSITAFVERGDHILVADSVYGATRKFCSLMLKKLGVEVSFFDPCIGSDISDLFRKNTVVVFLESPGSQLFEISDIPAIAAAAKNANIITLMDNTWATPLLCKPLELGVDVSIQSGTKYLSGHSDVMLGMISVKSREHFERLKDTVGLWGNCAAPDDCYLVLRGMRTLDVRMERHQRNALTLIKWLQKQPEVLKIHYPALPSDLGYEIWKRDFTGASGLFGVSLQHMGDEKTAAFFNHLTLFGMGSSWGGYESLMVPAWPRPHREFNIPKEDFSLIRIHAGLEDSGDLLDDLGLAFQRLREF